jgi:quinol-cytochrome oxidoreductase complex cytochrome b subunit
MQFLLKNLLPCPIVARHCCVENEEGPGIREPVFLSTVKSGRQRRQHLKKSKFSSFVFHIHPRSVPAETLRLTHTFGLGGMSLILFLLMVITGPLLLFVYEPHPARAYDSVLVLQNQVLFGGFVRNIHHWSGNALVIVGFLHLLRVFFTGGFQLPRRLNWVFGLLLFFLILVANFTGYLLPWDQLAFWAITICTSMLSYLPGIGQWAQTIVRGGEEVGPATLSTFFTFHVIIIPVCLFAILPFLFWRVRKAWGVVWPGVKDDKMGETRLPVIPDLVLRELVTALVLVAAIFCVAVLFDAPLQAKANPGLSPNPAKAPWFFAGLQEMLLHFHPFFSVWVIPLLAAGTLFALPLIQNDPEGAGVWFRSQKGRRMGAVGAAAALVLVPLFILGSHYFIDVSIWLPQAPKMVASGLFPLVVLLAALTGFYLMMKRRFAASHVETTQALFILLLVSYGVLTITGLWFRGEGMALVFPGF